MARLIARTVVASGLASRCTVTLAYMIGRPDPVQVDVDMYAPAAVYGHYGRTGLDLPWESSAHADELRRLTLGPAA